MLPPNHISLLVTDAQRAKEWKLGLRRQGIPVQLTPTSGSDAAKGDYWISVVESDRFRAQGFVTKVLAGQADLPHVSMISGPLLWGVAIIVITMLGLFVAVALS